MNQWIQTESQNADFGDKRLNNRYAKILEQLSISPSSTIPASCSGWGDTMGAYRFLRNPEVDFDKLLHCHRKAVKDRLSLVDEILFIQDTTSIDLTDHRSEKNLGHLESGSHRGIFLHPTIAVTTDKINLGIIGAEIWTRDIETKGKKQARKQKEISDKESNRWLKSYLMADKYANENLGKKVISIGDRESDIYEIFAAATKESSKAKILVRASQNRRLAMENKETMLLWTALESTEEWGTKPLTIVQTQHHKSRETELSIRVKELTLKAPYRKGKKLEDIKLKAVLAVEKNPPSDEDKIEWMLLTTLEINNIEDAIKVIDYYSCRWQIELFFRILKDGCKIEKLQLEELSTLENAIAVYMIISWRIQYLLMLGRQCPEMSADTVFSEAECKVIYVVNNKPIPERMLTLNEMIIIVACLGGYLNRKGDYPPGVKVFWVGLSKLANYAFVYDKMVKRKDVYN
jgi:hypothetical protein